MHSSVGSRTEHRYSRRSEFHADLKSQLYKLSPLDPMAISIAVAAVTIMTIAAAWLPAWRATKIDPIQALRAE
jgi:ABC-type antimicrobial peptide transport system permease subunit